MIISVDFPDDFMSIAILMILPCITGLDTASFA